MAMIGRPILFSGPMVKAILNGQKTQTRRIVRAPKCATINGRVSRDDKHFVDDGGALTPKGEQYLHWAYGGGDCGCDVLQQRVFSPYGTLGDRLWVRETWCEATKWYPANAFAYRADHEEHEYREHHRGCSYEKDGRKNFDCMACGFEQWRPSIFMPRNASRISLKIERIRVERLNNITESDACAEGVGNPITRDCKVPKFAALWDKINGKRAPWASNPFVWVVEFRRLG
jgi:hypothetical protein